MLIRKKTSKNQIKEEINNKILRTLVGLQKAADKYILDDENAIIVVNSAETTGYIMIHERLVAGKLVEINSWTIDSYHFGYIQQISQIKELNLFKVQNNCGEFNALYDYKNGKFVIPGKIWGLLNFGNDNKMIEKYNGILASFSISSDFEEGDVCTYKSPLTGQKIVESFSVTDGNYYAILNMDGSIRGNKLFKGNSFSKITKIIDLNEYESLDAFKKEIKQLCNDTKKKKKQEYHKLLESRNDGSISPYLDSEVIKILELRK